ncbi:MAG: FtsX-like permease family protein, partial [Terriglobales bacterium]
DYTMVVGMAKDSKIFSLSEDPTDMAYFPLAQYPATALGLAVHTAGSPATVLNEMRDAVRELNPQLAVTQLEAAEAPIQQSLWMAQMGAGLLGALALLATLLAAIGIYGVMSYGVRQRSRELGIRIALGASAQQVFGLVMRGGMGLVVIGIGIGIIGALLLARLVATLLFGLQPADPTTFLGYSLLFLAIAGLASFFPARRATRVDPIQTLRND